MSHSRVFALLLATISLLAGSLAQAQIGIEPIAGQTIPSGKTLVVPITATDPGGPARTYSVTVTGTAPEAGFNAVVRTGDPHFILGVSYTDSNSVQQTGTMEFQLLREFTPMTTQIISGLTEGGFYSPKTTGTGPQYVDFHRVVAGFVIQGGDPTGTATGGPGFTFPNEFNKDLIFSGTAGQLAMANSGYGVNAESPSPSLTSTSGGGFVQSFGALSNGTDADGATPLAGLVAGTNGALYGTTQTGGTGGGGTVYEFTSGTAPAVHTLYSFTGGGDGGNPSGNLLLGANGAFYGTTGSGASGYGTVFEITASGSLTTLASFSGTNGANPYAGLATGTSGTDGIYYGTAVNGGTNNYGAIFQVVTTGTPAIDLLYSFTDYRDGEYPYGGVVTGTDGNLYGTAENGGDPGNGTIYELTTSGSFSVIFSFANDSNGGSPYSGLVNDSDGNLYGTTSTGGANGTGTIYRIAASGTNPQTPTTLYSFSALTNGTNSDGAAPEAALFPGTNGVLYGTTTTGGVNGNGTAFEISTAGTFVPLYSFSASTNGTNSDGAVPTGTLYTGTDPYIYGTASTGGTNGTGTVFRLASHAGAISSGSNGTNGSQFFVTLSGTNRQSLDFTYTLFGQLLRGYDTLFGIAGTPVQPNASGEDSSPIFPVDITSAAVAQNNTDAVLLLSATGQLQGIVTVTATAPGEVATTSTFAVTGTADTVDDPPFLSPVPNITAPNGKAKVTLEGTDLQLDLLRYGYLRLLPVTDSSITSGTSPILSIPLISNTDNNVAALLDHWNASRRGYDVRDFHIGAGDKPIAGKLAAIAPRRTGEMALSSSAPLVVFAAGNPKDTAAGFTTSVNWGDGTYLSGSGISIVKDSAPGAAHRFKLISNHAYGSPGQYPLYVDIADPGGARLSLTGTVNVSSTSIAISGEDVYHSGGTLKNRVLATFNDISAPSGVASEYSATIDWGDGTVSAGTIKDGKKPNFEVLGSHTYTTPNNFTVSTVVTRGTTGNSASEWSIAHITDVTPSQFFPPFPQAHLAQIWSPVYNDSYDVLVTATSNGGNPYAALVQGTNGDFYGTTYADGPNNTGVIFQATETTSTSGSTVSTVVASAVAPVYAFSPLVNGTNSDGANPYAALFTGTDGNYYGTTVNGGAGGEGTVFQLTSSGTLNTLHAFGALSMTGTTMTASGTNADGANPYAGVIQGDDGNFYGATLNGGSYGLGTIYEVSTSGSFASLYSFTGGADGAAPVGNLIELSDSNFYGTTSKGGADHDGTIYELSSSGSFTTLYTFTGGDDGGNPKTGLISGTDGALYGTTVTDGSNGSGTVYELTSSGSFTTLYTFSALVTNSNGIQANADGANPYGLTTGSDGYLYGTTAAGGASGVGTFFELTTSGSFTTLYSFTGADDGGSPYAGVISGTDGIFYGTTETDGSYGGGTFYGISVSSTSGSTGSLVTRGLVQRNHPRRHRHHLPGGCPGLGHRRQRGRCTKHQRVSLGLYRSERLARHSGRGADRPGGVRADELSDPAVESRQILYHYLPPGWRSR